MEPTNRVKSTEKKSGKWGTGGTPHSSPHPSSTYEYPPSLRSIEAYRERLFLQGVISREEYERKPDRYVADNLDWHNVSLDTFIAEGGWGP